MPWRTLFLGLPWKYPCCEGLLCSGGLCKSPLCSRGPESQCLSPWGHSKDLLLSCRHSLRLHWSCYSPVGILGDSPGPVAVKPASALDDVEPLPEPTGSGLSAHQWPSVVRSSAVRKGGSVRHSPWPPSVFGQMRRTPVVQLTFPTCFLSSRLLAFPNRFLCANFLVFLTLFLSALSPWFAPYLLFLLSVCSCEFLVF